MFDKLLSFLVPWSSSSAAGTIESEMDLSHGRPSREGGERTHRETEFTQSIRPPYSQVVTRGSHTNPSNKEVAQARGGVLNNKAGAPSQVGAWSSHLQNASTTDSRRYPSTSYDAHQHPALPPPVAHSQSLHANARDNRSMESEVEQLKKSLELANGQLAAYQRENESLNKKLFDEQQSMYRARADIQTLRIDLNKYKTENRNLRWDLESMAKSTNKLCALEAKFQESESALSSTMNDLKDTKNQLKDMAEQKAQMDTLLKDRTFELKGAQSFLTTADTFSGADIISMVQRLNAEILQSAAYIAESMVDAFPFRSGGEGDEGTCGKVAGVFGPLLAQYLATKAHKNDPLLIQITFQSCLVRFIEFVIGSWAFPGGEVNEAFAGTYERMCRGEAQAISGRWRALTCAYAPSHEDDQIIAQVTSQLAGQFTTIMLASGCSASPNALRVSAEKKLSDKIILLYKMATQIKKSVMEEITSSDHRMVIVPGGIAYYEEEMEDAYVDGEPATHGVRVLCTTDLGLSRTTRLATSGDKQWDTKLFLKPKVALETVVNSMDE